MANIHHLTARSDQPSNRTETNRGRSADRPAGQTATIILFTGVRYERWLDAPQTALEAALSIPVDETGSPRVKGPTKGRSKA
jgi:hypothetical protein